MDLNRLKAFQLSVHGSIFIIHGQPVDSTHYEYILRLRLNSVSFWITLMQSHKVLKHSFERW
jgi:hypothetical protein